MDRILAVDVGTQSLKVCVFHGQLRRLRERVQVSYPPRVVRGRSRVEMDAYLLWEALVRACLSLDEIHDVQAVSFSTLCPSLVAMDGEGWPLGPVTLLLHRRSHAQPLWALRRSEAYTLCKQRKVRGYEFISMGETAPKGAAKLALQTTDAGL